MLIGRGGIEPPVGGEPFGRPVSDWPMTGCFCNNGKGPKMKSATTHAFSEFEGSQSIPTVFPLWLVIEVRSKSGKAVEQSRRFHWVQAANEPDSPKASAQQNEVDEKLIEDLRRSLLAPSTVSA